MQDVIRPAKSARTLHGDDIRRILHDADRCLVAPIVGADGTQPAGLGDIAATLAEGKLGLHLLERIGQAGYVLIRLTHQPKGNSLRRLRTHAGKSTKFVDDRLQRWRVTHEISSAPGNISVMR